MRLIIQAVASLLRKFRYEVDALKQWAVHPNWNQDDETAANYVKGRTHYTSVIQKTVEVEMVEESSSGGYTTIGSENAAFLWENRKNATDNTKFYGSTDNGCTYSKDSDNSDFSFAMGDSLSSTRYWVAVDIEAGVVHTYYMNQGGPIGTLTVTVEVEEVHKLDAKYLPDTVFVIDTTSNDYSNADTTYGNTIKEALLNGKTVYFYDGTFHIVTSGFRIIESTTGDAFLQIYRNLTPTNGSLAPGVTFMTFPITV